MLEIEFALCYSLHYKIKIYKLIEANLQYKEETF